MQVLGFSQPVIGVNLTGTIYDPSGAPVQMVSEQVGQGLRSGQSGDLLICTGTEVLPGGYTGQYTFTAFIRPVRP